MKRDVREPCFIEMGGVWGESEKGGVRIRVVLGASLKLLISYTVPLMI